MSEAIERPEGGVHFVTRLCELRRFRLVPSEETRGAFHVVLRRATEVTGVRLLGFCAMSDHYHAVVEDPGGRLGDWTSYVNGQLARYFNAVQETPGSHVWDACEENSIELEGLAQIADKVAYTLVNPVRAGLVYAPSAWPGAITRVGDLGTGKGSVVARRPRGYFREDGPLPKEAALPSHTPAGYTQEEFVRAVARELDEQLAAARAAVGASGRGYLGAERVMQQDPLSSPTTPHPKTQRQGSMPRFLGSSEEQTAAMVARHLDFRARYQACLVRFRRGERDVVFPPGTFKLHFRYGVEREPWGGEPPPGGDDLAQLAAASAGS